jgi:hypothetical protein
VANPELTAAVIAELEAATYPAGELNNEEAWLGIIQLVSWYEHGYLHIIDADKLHPRPKVKGKRVAEPRHDRTWQVRAEAAEEYIALQLGKSRDDVKNLLGRMWRHEFWEDCENGNQKANPAGNALKFVTAYVMQKWGDARFDYREEQPLTIYWPNIAIPHVKQPKADVLAVERVGSRPVALVSCKWSMRTDRVSNSNNECAIVKATAHRMTGSIRFYVVCHEYDGSRIVALLKDDCVDGVALVNLPVMEAIGIVSPELQEARANGRLLTLAELVDDTGNW